MAVNGEQNQANSVPSTTLAMSLILTDKMKIGLAPSGIRNGDILWDLEPWPVIAATRQHDGRGIVLGKVVICDQRLRLLPGHDPPSFIHYNDHVRVSNRRAFQANPKSHDERLHSRGTDSSSLFVRKGTGGDPTPVILHVRRGIMALKRFEDSRLKRRSERLRIQKSAASSR